MKAEAKGVQEVFVVGRTLEVPYYQREYVWENDEWERFFDDIVDAFNKKQDYPDAPIHIFLGSIILQKKRPYTESEWEIIDGQQRLTTINLFFKALYLLINNNEAFNTVFRNLPRNGERLLKLISNRNDTSAFEEVMRVEDLIPVRILPQMSKNIINCFNYFKERLSSLRDGNDETFPGKYDLDVLAEVSMEIIKLIQIEVEYQEDAQIIFEAINSLGQKLTTAELLKNYLYSKNNTNDYDSYINGWKQVFESVHSDYWRQDQTQGRTHGRLIEIFLHRFLLVLVHHVDYKHMFTQKVLKYLRKQDGLYQKYKDVINVLTARIPNFDKIQFAANIVEYAKKYMEAFPEDILNEVLVSNNSLKRLAFYMTAMDSWTMTPYILYLLSTVNDKTELEKIFAHLETYIVRRIVCPSKNNNYSDLFSENLIGQNVNSAAALLAYITNENDRGNLLVPSDGKVKSDIQTHTLTEKEANILLYLLESKINSDFKNFDRNTLEELIPVHLMPKDTKKIDLVDWPFADGYDNERREVLNKTLGNFVLLAKKNYKKQYTAKKWDDKKSYILNNKANIFETFIPITTIKWDETDIVSRNNFLAELIIKAWPIDGTFYQPARVALLNQEFRNFDNRRDLNGNVSYEYLYDDLTFEQGELDQSLQGFFNRYQRNGYMVIREVSYIKDSDSEIYGMIEFVSGTILPFIVKIKHSDAYHSYCRLFTLAAISPEEVERYTEEHFDAIIDEIYEQGVWED